MVNIKNISLFLFSFFLALPLFAQVQQAPEWTVSSSKETLKPGEETALIFKAEVPEGWYLYSSDFDPDLGPMLTEFEFKENDTYERIGGIQPVGQKKKYDELWEGEYTYFTGTAEFRQTLRVLKENPTIRGTISYQICSDESGQCIPFESDFSYGDGKGSETAAPVPANENRLQIKLDAARNAEQGDTGTGQKMADAAAGEIPVLELEPYYDYEQALACAREQNKPLFIDFTGHGCVNCREMEASVWSDSEVLRRLKEDYVVVALYVDEKTELPEEEWYISAYDQKIKKSIGKQNLDFMIQKLNANAQPYYTLVGNNGELLTAPKGYDLNVQRFIDFLDKGKEEFNKVSLSYNSNAEAK
jgi:thiol:disulfide interchange protein